MIGLATPYRMNNFGTKLQAYALQQTLSTMGYPNEIIDYRFGEKRKSLRNLLFGGSLRYRLNQRKKVSDDPAVQEGYRIRRAAFSRFTAGAYVFSPACNVLRDVKALAEKYDAVICGSDQIWLPSHICHHYYTLEFVPDGVKRIAYAPSFGISQLPAVFRKDYRRFLNQLDTVTVRETRGAELVKELTGKTCTVVSDPTLLLTKQQWTDLLQIGVTEASEKYVFAYFLGENPQHRIAAKQYAQKYGCKLILLPHIEGVVAADTEYADEAPYDVSPKEFVQLIANAQAVFTDSFHGSVFSILFERELFVCERFSGKSRHSTNSRIYSLLQMVGLNERLILGKDNRLPEQCGAIEYGAVNEKVEQYRQASLAVLQKALEKK